MKKLSFLLAVIMMLSFSACGGGNGTTSNEQTTQNTEQTEQATEETAEPAAEATAKSPDNDLVVAMQADATGGGRRSGPGHSCGRSAPPRPPAGGS